jgi:hypothetical protein
MKEGKAEHIKHRKLEDLNRSQLQEDENTDQVTEQDPANYD